MPRYRHRPNYNDLSEHWPITKVEIEVIPHLAQRYDTCGDWFRVVDEHGKATLRVFASRLDKEIDPYNYMAMCVAYHELGEALACIANDISEKDVDDWDLNYEGEDPGNDDNCPYVHQHRWATTIEKSLLVAMNILWSSYERAIAMLPKPWRHDKTKV